uniref:Uncharacterized protein n=1 Tax=Anguilla anguilla TaxID=7936 RepID=A0A0E9TFI8_ANGAN
MTSQSSRFQKFKCTLHTYKLPER